MKLRYTKYRHFLKKEITVLNLKYAYNALFFNLNSPSETVNVCTCILNFMLIMGLTLCGHLIIH